MGDSMVVNTNWVSADAAAFGAAVMVVLGGSMGRIHHVKWEICWPNLLVSAVVTAQLATT